jgi:hypothetical protein
VAVEGNCELALFKALVEFDIVAFSLKMKNSVNNKEKFITRKFFCSHSFAINLKGFAVMDPSEDI